VTESNDPRVVALEGVQEELELLRGDVRATREGVDDRIKTWRRLLLGFFALTLVAGFSSLQSRQAINDIVTARRDSRVGLCNFLDDMRARHNHFVETTIAERQQIIDATRASTTATPDQIDRSVTFFEGQIANYKTDLLEIVDCNNPDAVASLFTKGK